MKLTLTKAALGFIALQKIGTEKLPIKQAYNLQRNMRILEPDAKAYDEKRVELIKTKYGTEDEATGNWSIANKQMEAFNKELEELGSEEVELDIHTIVMETVTFTISPNDLYNLEWMFVEGPVTPVPPVPPVK